MSKPSRKANTPGKPAAKRRRSRAGGFVEVPGAYVYPGNEWNRAPLPALDIPPGDFDVWVAASHRGRRGPSACAWQIRRRGDVEPVISEAWPGRPIESSAQKGYVAAVLGALQRLPAGSTAVIHCNAEWVVDALNGGLDIWRSEGRLDGRDAVAYAEIWKPILLAIARIAKNPADIRAEHLRSDDALGQGIIARLQDEARDIRPSRR